MECVAISFLRDLPDLGIESMSPALAGKFFTTEPSEKLCSYVYVCVYTYICMCCAMHSCERLLLNHNARILGPEGEEFNPGPEMRLDRSELLCNKVLLK